jgi:hypothetical protein
LACRWPSGKSQVSQSRPATNATTLVRDTGCPEVHFAFKDEGDARRFAAAVQAEVTGNHPGWASQWAFELDSVRLAELEASRHRPRAAADVTGVPDLGAAESGRREAAVAEMSGNRLNRAMLIEAGAVDRRLESEGGEFAERRER